MEIETNINFKALKNLAKEMAKEYNIKVGLIASKGGNDTVSDNLDLAGLGAVQEFGCEINVTPKMRGYLAKALDIHLRKNTTKINIPARSWLQAPMQRTEDLLKSIKNKTQLIGEEIKLQEMIIKEYGDLGILDELAHAVGVSAVELIKKGFDTGGFGEWQPNSPATVRAKGSAKPLIDEGYLKSKISYEVEKAQK